MEQKWVMLTNLTFYSKNINNKLNNNFFKLLKV
jgi:hypothetical protein